MSNGNDIDFNGSDGGDDLRDPALRRALDHAPDHDATPAAHTRDAIRKMAHNLAAAPAQTPTSAANNASAAPWWRRLLGGGGSRARMPWNTAFATVLVVVFVTVLWRHEPIPDARLDGEARVAGAAAPAPAAAPAQPAAESVPQAPSPAIVAQQAPAAPAAEAPAAPARDSAKQAPAPARKEAAPAPEIKKESLPEPVSPPALAAAPATPAPSPPPAIAPAPPPAPVTAAPDVAEPSARVRQKSEDAQDERAKERRSAYAAAPAPSVAPPAVADLGINPPAGVAGPAAGSAPAAAAPLRRESADSSSAFAARGGNANAEASGALRDASPPRAASAKAARPSADAPSFSALDRWTAFDFTRASLGVRHARGDIEGLAALVNTVARSATATDAQPLAAPVEARLSLYQGSTLIAVLEIAGDQVRWTPQPGGTALVGTPQAQALAAMRALLTR